MRMPPATDTLRESTPHAWAAADTGMVVIAEHAAATLERNPVASLPSTSTVGAGSEASAVTGTDGTRPCTSTAAPTTRQPAAVQPRKNAGICCTAYSKS